MAGKLEGKVAIVTGASRGIGRALALRFASEGAAVVVAAKSEASTEKLPGSIHTVAEEIEAAGGRALAFRLDVRDETSCDDMAAATVKAFGRIDVLVNNAGAIYLQDVGDTPMKRFDLVMGVNVRGAFACTRACLPHLEATGFGHVLVYSPPVELAALPGKVAYLISKFGMTMLAHGLAEEMRGRGVAVNALWPVTAIESQATINWGLGGPAFWRTPLILVDATMEIVTTPPADLTGQALLDEDFLRTRGWTDFAKYRCVPDSEPPRIGILDLPRVGRVG